jgi:glycosyltransferase involved in cell wall biosynthesis
MDAIALVNGRGFRVKMVKAGRQGYVLTKFSDPKIARHVIDVGFIAHREVPRLLAAADVLIEPGRSNEFNDYRFPSKLPKYLASGKPVVLPRSNIGLLLKNGEEAMVLEHGDSADIADALQRLAADPDFAKQDRPKWPRLCVAQSRLDEEHCRLAELLRAVSRGRSQDAPDYR